MKTSSSVALLIVVLALVGSACGDSAATATVASPTTIAPSPTLVATTVGPTGAVPTSTRVIAVEPEGDFLLEGEWFDSIGSKILVVQGDTVEFFGLRGSYSVNLDADPNQITFSFEEGVFTTIFRLEEDRLDLVLVDAETPPPLPESIEAAAADPELYGVYELQRLRVEDLFPSDVWAPADSGLPPPFFVQGLAASGNVLVVGSHSPDFGTLFTSIDSGAHWEKAAGGFPQEEPAWALASVGGRLFVGTQGSGVFVSDDGAATWTASNEGLASPGADCPGDPGAAHSQIGDIAGFGSTVMVANFCGVWRSDDLGETWREANTGLNPNDAPFSLVVGDGFAYASAGQFGVFRTDLEQGVWEPVDDPGFLEPVDNLELPMALVETDGSLLLSSLGGVWRSDDRGDSWVQVGGLLPGDAVLDLAVADDGTIFAATLEGVYWTRDKGATWVAYNADLVRPIEALVVTGDRLVAGGLGVFSAPLP